MRRLPLHRAGGSGDEDWTRSGALQKRYEHLYTYWTESDMRSAFYSQKFWARTNHVDMRMRLQTCACQANAGMPW